MLELILYFGPVILVVLLVLLIITQGYVKAPPDHAYIISGLRKEPRVLVGRAGLKLPFFEQLDKLYLGQITVDIKTDEYIPTNDFINVMVDAVAKVRVADDPAMLKLAMRNFLNKNSAKIAADLQDSLQGNMREIIGTLTLRAINTDRDSFSDQVMAKASKDMEKLGIEILSCNIQNVTDEHGLIQDLGMDNTSKIRKDASIAKAEAERDIAIAQAAADKASNEARVLAETEIAQKNNELAIKKAELQKASDTKKAEADAAYEIQKQEQQKTIQAATVNAQIAKAEREAELRRQEVAVQQQALEAEINKKADADRYAIEQAAAADLTRRQREAEAKKYEQEKEAEARKAQAEAQKYAMLQEAEGIRARGEAEAAAIQAKALAEAEGMEKKAQAYQKYNHAAMAEMMMKVLPEIAGKIAEPLSQIDKITIIGGGNGSDDGVGNVAGNVPVVMAKLFESMKEATGVDLAEIMKADTYDAKVTRNINLNGAEDALKQVIAASDTKKAEADAAYEIQKQEQQKTIQAATVNAQIAKAEREAELRRQEVAVQQQALEAEINKKADADRYAIEQAAAADLTRRQREAEAKKYEQEKEAEARKAQAEAQKYAMLQEAEGIRARGEAEAAAIQAKALAEAEGMEKKAQAYQKYNHAAMAEMMMKVLPEIAGKIAEPLSQIDKITIIGGGNGSDDGVGNVAGNVPVVMAKLFESMKEATGVDLAEIMKADTYDAKVTRNINLNGAEDALKQVIAADTAPADKPVAENGATADTSSATVNS